MNQLDLTGRSVVVTGGARGIGYAVAARGRCDRAPRWRCGTSTARGSMSSAAALSGGGTVSTHVVELTDAAAVEAAARLTIAPHGRIDVLVNNAGITGGNAPTWELDARRLAPRARRQPHRLVSDLPRDRAAHDRARLRPHRQRRVDRGQGRQPERVALQRVEGGTHRADQVARQGAAPRNILVNCVTPAAAKTEIFGQMTQAHIDYMLARIPMGRLPRGGGDRGAGLLALDRGVLVLDRRGVRHQRRAGHVLSREGTYGNGR